MNDCGTFGTDLMRKHAARWAIVIFVLLMGLVRPVYAQAAITVVEQGHEHVFKESMTFSLAAEAKKEITSIRLFYRISGQTSAHRVDIAFDPGTNVEVSHTVDMTDPENYQPPMVEFSYWWVIEDEEGNRLKTEAASFVYEDTNYTWQVLEGEQVRLYWHDQDQAFGEGFFDAAVEAAARLSAEFDVEPKSPVAIVIYNSHEELMAVLQESSAEWTGAVTFGGRVGVIAVGLGQMSWMERVIPHELTHAMLFLVTKPPFGDIPQWLHEGLAMRSEGGISVEEQAALANAIENDTLIALRALNSPFPDQRDRAILSYAESNSLINFIIEAYGTHKLGEVISVFAEGAHYDDAMVEVFGVDMDGIEDLWREHIGARPREGVTRATPVPSATTAPTKEVVEQKTSTPVPETTSTAVAAVPTETATVPPQATATATSVPLVSETETPETTGGRGAPCIGAVPALGLLALFVVFRPRGR